jgi:hypothetical protein
VSIYASATPEKNQDNHHHNTHTYRL